MMVKRFFVLLYLSEPAVYTTKRIIYIIIIIIIITCCVTCFIYTHTKGSVQ
jgi:Mg2+ and Co2+ transporter CorA